MLYIPDTKAIKYRFSFVNERTYKSLKSDFSLINSALYERYLVKLTFIFIDYVIYV
jgi:hypothetical protein